MKLQFRVACRLLALGSLSILAGCGATHWQTRETGSQVKSEWREDGRTFHQLGTPSLYKEQVHVPIMEGYTEKEFHFTETYTESRRVKEPNMFMILISPLTMFVACLDGGCFGKYPSWSSDSPQRSTKTSSGNVRTKYRANRSTVEANVARTGYGERQETIGSNQTRISGQGNIAIPIRQFAESLSERPTKIDIRVSLPGSNDVATFVGSDVLGPMRLYSEQWLPVEERSALYSKQLREKLLAHDWAGANVLFAKIEALGTPLKPSFIYHYGASLLKAGNRESGRRYLERYLKEAGQDAEYRAQAQQLLNSWDHRHDKQAHGSQQIRGGHRPRLHPASYYGRPCRVRHRTL